MLARKNRLTKRGSFSYVYRKGDSIRNDAIALFFVKSNSLLIGISVSNKVGKAVVRNKVKRRLRAVIRQYLPKINRRCQIVIVAKERTVNMEYVDIRRAVGDALLRSKLIENDNEET